ncbi:VapE domain-containing protein [Clostridium butyricum]|uniref:VapE domain-containing protein n=1 Tax=Clostridium butyricum TaxID=1492 RepID=UPI00374EA564
MELTKNSDMIMNKYIYDKVEDAIKNDKIDSLTKEELNIYCNRYDNESEGISSAYIDKKKKDIADVRQLQLPNTKEYLRNINNDNELKVFIKDDITEHTLKAVIKIIIESLRANPIFISNRKVFIDNIEDIVRKKGKGSFLNSEDIKNIANIIYNKFTSDSIFELYQGGIIKNTENFKIMLDILDIGVYDNVIKKSVTIKTQKEEREVCDADLVEIKSAYANLNVNYNKNEVNDFVNKVAKDNEKNPVKEFLVRNYDNNIDYFEQFCKAITLSEECNQEYSFNLLKKWLIQCVALAHNTDGIIETQGVLVLKGSQGIGKTTLLRKLSPHPSWVKDGHSLNLKDKDNVRECLRFWICELGELNSSFKKSDQDDLKAFLTKKVDEIRLPYAINISTYPRMTSFCASVNDDEFLRDKTGNRRFWILDIVDINLDYIRNMDVSGLWAQIYKEYIDGAEFYLSKEEMEALNTYNKQYTVNSTLSEMLKEILDYNKELRTVSASEFALELNRLKILPNHVKVDSRTVGKAFAELSLNKKTVNGTSRWSIPPINDEYIKDGIVKLFQ